MIPFTFEFHWLTTLVIPLLIAMAKIIEASMATIRIMFTSKGMRILAPLVGLFEIIIWLFAVSQVLSNLSNVANFIAYAIGFTIGNYVGITIERYLSLGNILIRIITSRDAKLLVKALTKQKYHVTHVDAQGEHGPVKVIFTVVKRKQLQNIVSLIKMCNPRAFYTVEDMRYVHEADVPVRIKHQTMNKFLRFRKDK